MKNKKYNIIVGVTVAVVIAALVGVFAFTRNTDNKSTEDMSNTQQPRTTDANNNKFATLKGDEFDEAYLADMLAHHEGAVSMSEMAGAATERKELLDLAQTIMQTQSEEIVNMQEWQSRWGYEITMNGHSSHAGMGNQMSGKMMDMWQKLNGLTGSDFDKKFLELMIEHHQQAVDMSKYASSNAAHQEIKDLAQAVITKQETEIAQMQQWQKDWGYISTGDANSMQGMNH